LAMNYSLSTMVEEGYDSLLLRTLGSSPKLRILDYLLDYKLNDFTKKEIIEALGMSKLTLYKYFKDLEELGLVTASRKDRTGNALQG